MARRWSISSRRGKAPIREGMCPRWVNTFSKGVLARREQPRRAFPVLSRPRTFLPGGNCCMESDCRSARER